MANSESREMYLETILKIQNEKGSVRSIDVAAQLDYSKPSVSRAVGVLKSEGLIVVDKDGIISFTKTGREKAFAVFDRHKALTAAFIKMGMSPDCAEDDACRVEHVISEDAFYAIKKYFNV